MAKKMFRWFPTFLLVFSLLFSCANPNIGKVLPEGNYPKVGKACHHYIVREHLILDYNCSISNDCRSLTFDGDVQMITSGFSAGWEVAELFLTVYFLDNQRQIIGVEYMSIWPRKAAAEKIKFKKTFKYNPQYKYVVYSYRSKAHL